MSVASSPLAPQHTLAQARAENAVMLRCLLTVAFRDSVKVLHASMTQEASLKLRDGTHCELALTAVQKRSGMSPHWPTAYTIEVRRKSEDEDEEDDVLFTATEQRNLKDRREHEAAFLALKYAVEAALDFLAAEVVSIKTEEFFIDLTAHTFGLGARPEPEDEDEE